MVRKLTEEITAESIAFTDGALAAAGHFVDGGEIRSTKLWSEQLLEHSGEPAAPLVQRVACIFSRERGDLLREQLVTRP